MAREIYCRDVGPDCDAVVVAETDEEIVEHVARHAREVHGMSEEQVGDPAFIEHVRNQIHNEDGTA